MLESQENPMPLLVVEGELESNIIAKIILDDMNIVEFAVAR